MLRLQQNKWCRISDKVYRQARKGDAFQEFGYNPIVKSALLNEHYLAEWKWDLIVVGLGERCGNKSILVRHRVR